MTKQITFESSFDDSDIDDFSFADDIDDDDELELGFSKRKPTKRCLICQEKNCGGDCADLD